MGSVADQCAPRPAAPADFHHFRTHDWVGSAEDHRVTAVLIDTFGSIEEANAIGRGLLYGCIMAAADGVSPAARLGGDGTVMVVEARLEHYEPDEVTP